MSAAPPASDETRRSRAGRRAFTCAAILLSACLSSACSATPVTPLPRSVVEPSVDAEMRLWHQAETAASDGRYSSAVHLFSRYLSAYPKSFRVAQAHWELGQAYEQMGEITAALAEYRWLTAPAGGGAASPSSYAERASTRIEALHRQPVSPTASKAGHTAFYVSAKNMPAADQVDTWVKQLNAQGISALLVDAGSESSFTRIPVPIGGPPPSPAETAPRGAFFATAQGPVLADWYRVIVPQAHELGMSVFAVLDLFHAPLSESRPEARVMLYDPTKRRVFPWTQFDLLSPLVQAALSKLLTDLLRTGVDGIVFRARADNSFAYEVSDGMLRRFEAEFHQSSVDVAQALRDHVTTRPNPAASTSDKTLWRWVGWKARQELDLLAQLKKQVQKVTPRLRIVLEVHPEALSNPTSALMNYGEDAAEARRRGLDLLLGGATRSPADVRAFAGPLKGWNRDVVQAAKGEPQTLPQGWVLLHTPGEYGAGMFTGLAQQADELRTPDIRHIVFVPDPPEPVP